MAQLRGMDFIINVNTGTDVAPVWTKVGGQRGASLNLSAESLETTSKDTQGFKTFAQGFKEWSIDTDGLLVDGDAGFQALEDAFMDSKQVKVQLASPSGYKWEGLAIITDFSQEFSYDDYATYSCAFTGSSALVKVTV